MRSFNFTSIRSIAAICGGIVALSLTAPNAQAQWGQPVSADTQVIVGPGQAGATAGANGMWQHAETKTNVGSHGSMARGFAVGAGPNGLALSHSIGGNVLGNSVGHNFNLSIGQGGTHVSHGAVKSSGGNPTIIAGGGTQQGGWGNVSGGSTVGGFGNNTKTNTGAITRLWRRR